MSDEYETPDLLYSVLCSQYKIEPELDVCATSLNTKCDNFLSDGLTSDWLVDVWCNPPHNKIKANGKVQSQTGLFVKKAYEQWMKHNINIMMIIPANSICTEYSQMYIQNMAEIHPIYGRPRFLVDGKPAKDSARNSYFVVIWRKRDEKVL